MTLRRFPPRHLKLVAATDQPAEPANVVTNHEPIETEIDRVIRPIVEAGRSIIRSGVAGLVDAAAGFGLDWDHNRDELRVGISDIMGRKLHDDVVAQCSLHGIDHDAAVRRLLHGDGSQAAVKTITDSIMHDIAKVLARYDCPSGSPASRVLRAAVQEIVGGKLQVSQP